MTARVGLSAEAFLARYAGLRVQLPGDPAAREAAAALLRARGLPGPREEAWRHTPLRPLAEGSFHEPITPVGALAGDGEALLARLPLAGAPRLVFIDGRFRADLSRLPSGIGVETFAEAPDFGAAVAPEDAPLVALNTLLAEDGAVITVPAGVQAGTLLLASLATGSPARPVAFHPRHTIRLGEGASLVLLEVATGEGTYFHNPLMQVSVAAGARLTHARLQDEAAGAFSLATVFTDVAAGGTYDSFSLAIGARLSRLELRARLEGPEAAAHLNAAQVLSGIQHADFTTVVRHDAPHCASRQTVRNVLAGRAHAVFQGRIEVARGAQKTDGYQMNQTLLLSPEAQIDAKPELEIYADDVKCSHGATVGELDAEQLFYLRSRGVPEAEARAMLVRAFLAGALDAVADETVRDVLDRAVDHWWERQAA
jgi:Fe-S cluster assembly protein SufD